MIQFQKWSRHMKQFGKCPRCGAPTIPAIAYNDGESEFWRKCSRCNTFINTYIPQPHQAAIHSDVHTYIGNFGGYGTGKTYTSRQEVYKHALITPNANILICANVATQYEQTIKRDIEADIPKDFVKFYSAQKQYMDLVNGARIIYRPLDDPDKLRSLNLSMFVIIEASETSPETFTQLKTRSRNLVAAVPVIDPTTQLPMMHTLDNGAQVPIIKTSWIKGIIESNPDSGWIRNDVLHVADTIQTHGNVVDDTVVPDAIKDVAISAHITSTDANAFLPPDYIDQQCKNKPLWWISRFIYGSFSFAEGLVYPSAVHNIVPYHEIPAEWKRIIAADYGLSDDFVYLCGAIDEHDGILYIYKEVRTNNKSIEDLARIYFDEVGSDIPVGGMYCTPLLDPKSGAKRDYNKKTLYDHFLDYGIYFQPGAISVDARVFRLNTYLESGRCKIMDNCTGLIKEIEDYKFPPKTLGKSTKSEDKPMDKNNHAVNPLEWIAMALPKDPKSLMYGCYDKYGNDLNNPNSDQYSFIPPQLRDDVDTQTNVYDWSD